jgi:uncharacterized membrane protein (DUF485 family)
MNSKQRRADIDEATRAKVRRSAWSLALLAVAFYLTFILWNAYRASQGI